jgi:acyl-CoA thioester hydrolase
MKVRVYYHDTDCGGVVYYANYLKYLEQARTAYLEERGLSIKELAGKGILFVVARQEIDYRYPARYGDILEVSTRILGASTVKIEYGHEIKNQSGQEICQAKTFLVCVDKDIRPKAIPEEIKAKIRG